MSPRVHPTMEGDNEPAVPLDVVQMILDVLASPLAADCEVRVSDNLLTPQSGDVNRFRDTWQFTPYTFLERQSKTHLRTCALVSRTWAQLVRPRLFSMIALHFFPKSSVCYPERNFAQLVGLLGSSEFPSQLVKRLRLIMAINMDDKCDVTVLQAILVHCSNLRVLELFEFQVDNWPDLHNGYVPRNLDRVYISMSDLPEGLGFCSVKDILRILSCFGEIGELQLEVTPIAGHIIDDPEESIAIPEELRIRALDIVFGYVPLPLVAALRKSPTIQLHQLVKLSIRTFELRSPGLRALWNEVVPFLEALQLTYGCVEQSQSEVDLILYDVLALERLRELTMVFRSTDLTNVPYHGWKYLEMLLSEFVPRPSRAYPPALQVVTIRFWELDDYCTSAKVLGMVYDCPILAKVDVILGAIPSLTRVVFEKKSQLPGMRDPWMDGERGEVTDVFPSLRSTGRLQLRSYYPT